MFVKEKKKLELEPKLVEYFIHRSDDIKIL